MAYLRWPTVAAATLIASAAFAQAGAKDTLAPDKQVQSVEEAAVLAKLHQANKMEIEAGEQAKDDAESPKVKSYGEQLVKDHERADKMVRDYADKKGIDLRQQDSPSEAEKQEAKAEKTKMDALDALDGKEFDREFVRMMVADHQRVLAMVKNTRSETKNSDLRALLATLQPVLQKHLSRAQALERELER